MTPSSTDAGSHGNAISLPDSPDSAPPTTQFPASALAKPPRSDMEEEDKDSNDFAHDFHDGSDRDIDEQKMHLEQAEQELGSNQVSHIGGA